MTEVKVTSNAVVEFAHDRDSNDFVYDDLPLFMPTYKKLPKLTEKDFQELEKCRYIRRPRRQCKDGGDTSIIDASFLRDDVFSDYVNNKEEKNLEQSFEQNTSANEDQFKPTDDISEEERDNPKSRPSEYRSQSPQFRDLPNHQQCDGSLFKPASKHVSQRRSPLSCHSKSPNSQLEVTQSSPSSRISESSDEDREAKPITFCKSEIVLLDYDILPKIRPFSTKSKGEQSSNCPAIKPLVPVVTVSRDMRNYLIPDTSTNKSPLNQRSVKLLQLNFDKKCNVTKPKSFNNSDTAEEMDVEKDDKKRLNSCRKRITSVKAKSLYKEISLAAKRLDLSIDNIVRDVKYKRGSVGVDAPPIQSIQKWSLLAVMVRSGLLLRNETPVSSTMKVRRSVKKPLGKYSVKPHLLSSSRTSPRVQNAINLCRLTELKDVEKRGKFGVLRKQLLDGDMPVSFCTTKLPHILPSHVLDKVFPPSSKQNTNRRNSGYI